MSVLILVMIQVFDYLCVSIFVSVLILAMIQDQALVASKHYLVETKDKNLADNLAETEDKIEDGLGTSISL